ncbi:MAG: chemotaxis protein CheR [Alphaproteobacteria bacterium CG_4_9_14_3_um_filter_47_13]|nr:MAG: chemotaxis protein CheR [Alphaproteobacteria bacterium CG_4_9_14_3_um_filter_47_13]
MRISDFDLYRDLLIKKSGLSLTPDKSYLLDSRLTPVSKKWGFATLDAMTVALRGMPDPALIKEVIEAMTTNETSFFRDSKPFELFRQVVLPFMAKKRAANKSIKIWCAASSSGQEPYSLAMTILENRHLIPGWKVEIVATDISDDILKKAIAGEYSQFEVQRGLPIQLLIKYFDQKDDKWVIKEELRKMIRYKTFNLLNDMTALGTFDIVFCRNVLIYFDHATKQDILSRMSKRMASDGFLFLGGAETVLGFTDEFRMMEGHRGLYALSKGTYDMAELAKAASQ